MSKREKIKNAVNKGKIKDGISGFQREFRKHLAEFITSAFAFVAALLWRDAISSFLERYQEILKNSMPIKELWATQLLTAFLVSLVAVAAIVVITKLLKR